MSNIEQPYAYLKNQPVPVEFLGWRSDTYRLQQSGWQIAMFKDTQRFHDVFVFHNEHLKLEGVSEGYDSYGAISQRMLDGRFDQTRVPPIRIRYLGKLQVICMQMDMGIMSAQPVDCQPAMCERHEFEVESLFQVVPNKAQSVLVDKADMSVVEHLQSIVNGQKAKQAELRQKKRRNHGGTQKDMDSGISDIILQVRAA